MFPFFSYFHHNTNLSKLFFLVSYLLLFPANSATTANTSSWHGLMRFLDAGKGSQVDGMAELKSYFLRFGYLQLIPDPLPPGNNINFTDIFDDQLETALLSYQKNLGLPATGKLDSDTMRAVVSPRCGVSDLAIKTTRKFAYFHGKPRYRRRRSTHMTLTYAFSPENVIGYVSPSDLKAVFRRAFSRWSAVIPVSFAEAEDYSAADIRIGWYRGDHGDGEAFDGVLGVLAHAFSPENGRLHLDAAERWAVDFEAERSEVAVDLESVATHEIGHVLGLAHSSVKEAVMYPSLSPRTKKAELRMDDVEGIQALYGSNPDYRYDSRLESELSSAGGGGGMMDLGTRKGLMIPGLLLLLLIHF